MSTADVDRVLARCESDLREARFLLRSGTGALSLAAIGTSRKAPKLAHSRRVLEAAEQELIELDEALDDVLALLRVARALRATPEVGAP